MAGLIGSATDGGGYKRMFSEWKDYFQNTKAGDVTKEPNTGGTLTRTANGAVYTGLGGQTTQLDASNPDFESLAKQSPELAAAWKANYGWEPTPAAPTVAQWTPTTREVQPTDTVAEQMRSLLAENSPYLQEAEKGAMRTANARGLLNSSIAAGAGRGAAISAAMPIATQDAATYFSQGQSNQNVTNQAGQFNAGAQNTANLAKFSVESDIFKQNLANLQDLQKMGVAQGYNLENMSQQQLNDLAKMATAQGYNIATMDAQQVNDLAKLAAQGAQQQAQITLQGDINKQLATLDNQFKTQLAEGDDARLRALEAAKNAAALNAQYIQAAGAVNQSDMSVQDKKAQLETLRQDTNNAIRDTYRMFMPNASDAEVQAAVDDANATQDSLEAINDRLDQIAKDIGGGDQGGGRNETARNFSDG